MSAPARQSADLDTYERQLGRRSARRERIHGLFVIAGLVTGAIACAFVAGVLDGLWIRWVVSR